MLFQLINKRYEKHSTIITTNKPFGKWHEIFNDVTLANAILDRLLHHSYIININGNSYRLKDKLKIDSESSEPIQNWLQKSYIFIFNFFYIFILTLTMAYYTYDEFKKFISYEEDLRWKCVFEILYYCGLRKGELKGLTWKDIYFDKKVLSVNKQITQRNNRVKFEFSDTKTRDSRRIVPITKVLLNDLKMLYEQDKKDYYGFNDDFFVVSDAKPIADSNIYLRRTKLANLAGLKVIRIHDFRHSCASLLINNGANVTLVAKYLGHTKIEETLNTYSHMFSTTLDSVVSVIDSLEDD